MATAEAPQGQADFFVSFSNHDKPWADWIAWVLDEQGYTIIYQPWDFAPGTNFVLQMNKAAGSAKTIAVLSDNYINSNFAQPEWAAAFADDPTGFSRKLIPIRISECDLKGTLLAQIVYIDLAGTFDQEIAKQTLLDGLKSVKPSEAPEYPSPTGKHPPFPGTIADPASRAESVDRKGNLPLPPPGLRVQFSPPYIPPTFRGIQIHPENPLVLDFILDSGDANLGLRNLGEVSLRLTKYFLTALTVPDEHLWVNLSPHEEGRIIPEDLARTQMGIDLLAQDYILKQVTSTASYPEKEVGKAYWQNLFEKTHGGSDPESINALNKIWITPKSARITERGTFAIVEDCKLRVQLEHDYVASTAIKESVRGAPDYRRLSPEDQAAVNVFKQTILPLIQTDVGEGGNFAVLRQIFSAQILAVWYKELLKRSIMADMYINRPTTAGVAHPSGITAKDIYEQYLESYRVGVFEYIHEDVVGPGADDVVPRKYFSGGFSGTEIHKISAKKRSKRLLLKSRASAGAGRLYWVRMNLSEHDSEFIGEKYYDEEDVGGINLSTSNDFHLDIESDGLRFQLSEALSERLKKTGIGGLQPKVIFVKSIERDSLEISSEVDLSTILKQVEGADSPQPTKPSTESDGVVARLQRAWAAFRGSDVSSK